MNNENLVCIVCPNGCRMQIKALKEGFVVTGNKCARGKAFAEQEMSAPKRNLTTTLATRYADCLTLPVKLNREVDKRVLPAIMDVCHSLVVARPIRRGEVIVANIANSGADLIASSDILYTLHGE